jgi:lipoate-protein ligase A
MTHSWFLIDSEPTDPALNMALDEALMVFGPLLKLPMVRFYRWSKPASTFGYFQSISTVEQLTPLRPLIRRPTGGGLVPHESDWTYSLVLPPGHEWHALRASESYQRLHRWLQSAWARLGVHTLLAPQARHDGPGRCFVGAEQHDLLWQDHKIAGAAQRRSKHGLLIQGSVQDMPNGIDRRAWQQALCDTATQAWDADWIPLEPSGELLDHAHQLAADKYSQDRYNRKR